jgi:prepilin-type N-terminal cleavage/methylation domain-containing protein
MKKESGFTLLELMVVISITMLLLAWGIPSYSTWKKKHDIENQMIQLYDDLQFGRMTAYGTKVVTGVYWGGGATFASYQIKYDANNNNEIDDNVDQQVPGTMIMNLKYAITSSLSTQTSVSFDGRGFMDPGNPNPASPITFSVVPSYGAVMDCVQVSTTQIILGKMNGNSCKQK